MTGERDERGSRGTGVESSRVTRRVTEVRDLLCTVDATSARDAAEQLTEYTQQKGTA
ncbi:hypothetical protein [Streptomyces albicerus]|uniref:hypothetical protein n=1 Tax=Streptomyces albicerus TaxID=2569859 RepID=UPI001788B9A8|nr:hypothetical protein [Streptomyces albicerus]